MPRCLVLRMSVLLAPIEDALDHRAARLRHAGGRWRDLPEPLGDNRSAKRRDYRWIAMGVLDDILAVLSREADLEWLMIDSTIMRAHQHAAGARQSKGGADARAWAGLAAG